MEKKKYIWESKACWEGGHMAEVNGSRDIRQGGCAWVTTVLKSEVVLPSAARGTV